MLGFYSLAECTLGDLPHESGDDGSAPAAPTLVVTDNGDDTGAVATISGGESWATHTLFTQAVDGQLGTSEWTDQGDLLGNGDIDLDLPVGYYWAYAIASGSGGQTISNLVYLHVSNGDQSVHYRCLVAAQARIRTMLLTDIDSDNIVIYKLPWDRDFGDGKTYSYPGIILSSFQAEQQTPATNERDDIGYPVTVSIIAADNQDLTIHHELYLHWRERIARAFRFQRLPGVPEIIRTTVEPSANTLPDAFIRQVFHSALTLRFFSRETRGIA